VVIKRFPSFHNYHPQKTAHRRFFYKYPRYRANPFAWFLKRFLSFLNITHKKKPATARNEIRRSQSLSVVRFAGRRFLYKYIFFPNSCTFSSKCYSNLINLTITSSRVKFSGLIKYCNPNPFIWHFLLPCRR
jgi:hypothetical protein